MEKDEAANFNDGGSKIRKTCGTSGVAIKNYVGGSSGLFERPNRNLLVVIHPWCMLRKSGMDRQSEFPPPGFLERLKAKLLALHRETDEHVRQRPHQATATTAIATMRRRNNNQKIRFWMQYTAAVAAAAAFGGPRAAKTIKAGAYHREEHKAIDFLTIRRLYAVTTAVPSPQPPSLPLPLPLPLPATNSTTTTASNNTVSTNC